MGCSKIPLWQKSGSASRALFGKVLEKLEIGHLCFRPYSLRRGGATWEMQSHGLMERTLMSGRWKNSNVARIYTQDGLALLPKLILSWDAKRRSHQFSPVFTDKRCSNGKRGTKRHKIA